MLMTVTKKNKATDNFRNHKSKYCLKKTLKIRIRIYKEMNNHLSIKNSKFKNKILMIRYSLNSIYIKILKRNRINMQV